MLCLGRARLLFNLVKISSPPRPLILLPSPPHLVSTSTVSLPRRALSTSADSRNDIFNYTSGRWVYKDARRHKERRITFDVDELCRLAAESLNQNHDDVVSLSKLAEGGFNRTFIITFRDGQQMVARIPYPITVPKYYAVANEVATIEYLRSYGLPVPEIYGYSPESDNAAGTAYILMEFVQGSKLSDVWRGLNDQEVISVVHQLTQFESRMMSLSFPAGGSLYFTKDLEKPNNIIVSRSPDSGCKIVGLIDWQHTSILPMFLLAGIPQRFQNYDDEVSQSMTPPSLLENLDGLNEAERSHEEYIYRCRLVHYHYVLSTMEYNQLHYAAFTDPLYALRGRLFEQPGAPWEGEGFDLKSELIQVTKRWEELAEAGVPCPIKFDAEDIRETALLAEELSTAERGFEILQSMCDVGEEGWVLPEDYENAMAFLKEKKDQALAWSESEGKRQEIVNHWPWDDMDEEKYM